jgi:1,4-dihydroxy-2-naphthoyl-CoA hydrolase
MSFTYHRTIYFKDTDAAGVVYFSNALSICHEAYEALLETLTIDLKSYFSGQSIAVPIVHAEIDFMRPMTCGEQVYVTVSGKIVSGKIVSGKIQPESEFILNYEICRNDLENDRPIAKAMTRHVAIDPITRKRSTILPELAQWLAQG